MEIIYASLEFRRPGEAANESDVAAAVDALWVSALPSDGLQHVSARPEPGRIDVLFYLLSQDAPDTTGALSRARALIARSHRTSPRLHRLYLPPEPLAESTEPAARPTA
ncbi:hypothetical protein ACIOJE_39220 [Kitasatospora sp. NPDC087861]|uniref:hypothetical protein n=1 Tax=Kitasatospora sp. NPDC087861 TaxID=3364070 RepID=UPI003805F6B3